MLIYQDKIELIEAIQTSKACYNRSLMQLYKIP